MALSASWALFILVICACTVILQRNILIDPGLENVMKDIVSDFSYDDGNSEITYKECKDVSMMWKWIETTCEGLYDDESPPGESWSTMDIKNNSNLIPVPMSFKALQSINVISAVSLLCNLFNNRSMLVAHKSSQNTLKHSVEVSTVTNGQKIQSQKKLTRNIVYSYWKTMNLHKIQIIKDKSKPRLLNPTVNFSF